MSTLPPYTPEAVTAERARRRAALRPGEVPAGDIALGVTPEPSGAAAPEAPKLPAPEPVGVVSPTATIPHTLFTFRPAPPQVIDTPAGQAQLPVTPDVSRKVLQQGAEYADNMERSATSMAHNVGDTHPPDWQAIIDKQHGDALEYIGYALEPLAVPQRLAFRAGTLTAELAPDPGTPLGDLWQNFGAAESEALARSWSAYIAAPERAAASMLGRDTARADEASYTNELRNVGKRLYDAMATGKASDLAAYKQEPVEALGGVNVSNFLSGDILDYAFPKDAAGRMRDAVAPSAAEAVTQGRGAEWAFYDGMATSDTFRMVHGALLDVVADPLNFLGAGAGSEVVHIGDQAVRVTPTLVRAADAVKLATPGMERLPAVRQLAGAILESPTKARALLTDTGTRLELMRTAAVQTADAMRNGLVRLGDGTLAPLGRAATKAELQTVDAQVRSIAAAESAVAQLQSAITLAGHATPKGVLAVSLPVIGERTLGHVSDIFKPITAVVRHTSDALAPYRPAEIARLTATVPADLARTVLDPGQQLVYALTHGLTGRRGVDAALDAARTGTAALLDLPRVGVSVLGRLLGPRTFLPAFVDFGKMRPLHDTSELTALPGRASGIGERWREVARIPRALWETYHDHVGKFMAALQNGGAQVSASVMRFTRAAQAAYADAKALGKLGKLDTVQTFIDDAIDAIERGAGMLEGSKAHLQPVVDELRRLTADVAGVVGKPLDQARQALQIITRKMVGDPEAFNDVLDTLWAADDLFQHVAKDRGALWGEWFDKSMTTYLAASKALTSALTAITPDAFVAAVDTLRTTLSGAKVTYAERALLAQEALFDVITGGLTANGTAAPRDAKRIAVRVMSALQSVMGTSSPADAMLGLVAVVEGRAKFGDPITVAFHKVAQELAEEVREIEALLKGALPTKDRLNILARALSSRAVNALGAARGVVGDVDWAAFVDWAKQGGKTAPGKNAALDAINALTPADLTRIAEEIEQAKADDTLGTIDPMTLARVVANATNARDVLTYVMHNTKDFALFELADKMLAHLPTEISCHLDLAGVNGRAWGVYSPSTHTVRLTPPWKSIHGTTEVTVLHEMAHAVTYETIRAIEVVGSAHPDYATRVHFGTLWAAIDNTIRARPELLAGLSSDNIRNVNYYLTDVHELISGAFSDATFQNILKQIQIAPKLAKQAPKSMFTGFVDAVAKLLGISKPTARTALEQVIAHAAHFMENPNIRPGFELPAAATSHGRPGTPAAWVKALPLWRRAHRELAAARAAADVYGKVLAGAAPEAVARLFARAMDRRLAQLRAVLPDHLPSAGDVATAARLMTAQVAGGGPGTSTSTAIDLARQAILAKPVALRKLREFYAATAITERPRLPHVPVGVFDKPEGVKDGRTLEEWEVDQWTRAQAITANLSPEDRLIAVLGVLQDAAMLPGDLENVAAWRHLYGTKPGDVIGQRLGELRPDLAPVVTELRNLFAHYEALFDAKGVVRTVSPEDMMKRWGVVGYAPHMEDTKSLTAGEKLQGAMHQLGEVQRPREGATVEEIVSTDIDARKKREIGGAITEINNAANTAIRMTSDPSLILARYANANRALSAQDFLVHLIQSGVIQVLRPLRGQNVVDQAAERGLVPLVSRGEFARSWDILTRGRAGELAGAGLSALDASKALDALRTARDKGTGFATWMRSIPLVQRCEDIEEMLLSLRIRDFADSTQYVDNLLDAVDNLRQLPSTTARQRRVLADTWDKLAVAMNERALAAGSGRKTTGTALQGYFAADGAPFEMFVPAVVAQSMDDLFDIGAWAPGGFAGMAKAALDWTNNFMKVRMTVINTAFHTRNATFNQFSNLFDLGPFGVLNPRTQTTAALLPMIAHYVSEYGTLAAAEAALRAPKRPGESPLAYLTRKASYVAGFHASGVAEAARTGIDLGDGVKRPAEELVHDLLARGVLSGAYTGYADLAVLQHDLADTLVSGGKELAWERVKAVLGTAEDVALQVVAFGMTGGVPVVLPKKLGSIAASMIENQSRCANFIGNFRRTGNFDIATEHVGKFLFNYGDLTAFQKTWMRTLIPFWTWPSKNLWLQLSILGDSPRSYGWFTRAAITDGPALAEALDADIEDRAYDRMSPNDPSKLRLREDHERGKIRFKVPGYRNLYMSGLGTPQEAAFEFGNMITRIATGDFRVMAMGSFALRYLTELATGQNFYYDKPLSELTNAMPIAQTIAGLRAYEGIPVFGPIANWLASSLADAAELTEYARFNPRTHTWVPVPVADKHAVHAVGNVPWRQVILNSAAVADAYHMSLLTRAEDVSDGLEMQPVPAMFRYADALGALQFKQADPVYRAKQVHTVEPMTELRNEQVERQEIRRYDATTVPNPFPR